MRKHNWLHLIISIIFTMAVLVADFLIINDLRQREEIINQLSVNAGTVGLCSCEKESEVLRITKIRRVAKITKQPKTAVSVSGDKLNEIQCELPEIPTNVKFFTDYRYYSLWYTPHYRLQQLAWTDSQGLRRYNKDYIVALGSFYSTDIGDRFKITLDTGKTFTVILGDGKVDADCDSKNMYTPCVDYEGNAAANLLEFVIDENVLASEVYNYGSLDYLDEFKGNIIEMVYLGRDKSQDWDTYENN